MDDTGPHMAGVKTRHLKVGELSGLCGVPRADSELPGVYSLRAETRRRRTAALPLPNRRAAATVDCWTDRTASTTTGPSATVPSGMGLGEKARAGAGQISTGCDRGQVCWASTRSSTRTHRVSLKL
jgi:hypothetical protein